MDEHNLVLKDLFFWMGCFDTPHNPDGFPDVFPFELYPDMTTGVLCQKNNPALDDLLNKTYQYGSTVGNAMDDSPLGRSYCEDFLSFCKKSLRKNARILEIGAGRGYMASRLVEQGYKVDALEPGDVNKPYWKKYGVKIIQDFFPTDLAHGPYDASIFYGVFEHIYDTRTFLKNVKDHLSDNGVVLLSVPDCEIEIRNGDPSMLLHEHYHYFMASSLKRLLANSGFSASVENSTYGRSLYAAAVSDNNAFLAPVEKYDADDICAFSSKYAHQRAIIKKRVDDATSNGTLGIFCPGRILALLPEAEKIRFFDDSEDLHGKFYPPFPVPVESRSALLENAPDQIWIMSRTFGEKLKQQLFASGIKSKILLPDDVFNFA